MKVSVEKIDNKQVELTIEVDEAKVEEGMKHAYKKMVTKINIPGFRKGKVPRKIIEQRFGVEVFYEDAVDHLMPNAYIEALDSLEDPNKLIGKPNIEIVQIEAGKPFIFKAKVDVRPEIELGEYKGLELEKIDNVVTQEEVEKEIENLRQRHAQLEVMGEDAEVENADNILLDFIGKDEEVPFEGGTAEDYALEIGSGSFIPGFEEQLIGMKLGDDKVINITFPEEYHSKDLAGKPVTFDVKIKEIKRKKIADLDDEFAKDVSEFENLQELKTDVENKLKKQKEEMAQNKLRVQAIEKLVANHDFDVPEAMVQNQVDNFVQEFDYRLRSQGLSLEKYLEYSDVNMEEIRGQYKDDAVKAIKKDLILEAIVKAEDIKIEAEELEDELKRLAEAYKQEVVKVKEILESQGQLSAMEQSIKAEKALEIVIENAKVS